MDPIARFAEYAASFEDVYKSDDWSVLEPFFTEDAVYESVGAELLAGRHEGCEAVFAALKKSLDGFDRRFETRQLELLEGPALRDGAVWLHWRASYRSPGVPELVIEGEERAWFQEDRIAQLRDDFPLEIGNIVEHWMSHYARLIG